MNNSAAAAHSNASVKMLTYLMFFVFAMTTDAVGVIIPEVIKDHQLTLAQASVFHYGVMMAIAVSGALLGFLADRYGRKLAIILGLSLFALAAYILPVGNSFQFFLGCLLISGASIGIFKSAALALIGDISKDGDEHCATMNYAEGFFGLGAIIGPAIVAYLISNDMSWVYVYTAAGVCATVLVVIASCSKYPPKPKAEAKDVNWKTSLALLREPHAIIFSLACGLYVVVEAGVYVWLPTLLLDYNGSLTAWIPYALSIFFIFRAAGRFLGAAMLRWVGWQKVLVSFSAAIFVIFLISLTSGINTIAVLLPITGLFMSVIYPTLNSKGISYFPREKHGAAAGLLLFFTALSAALGPLIMGIIGDHMGHLKYGFGFAALCSGLLLAISCFIVIHQRGLDHEFAGEPSAE